ncbi:hypothetical protein I4F81_001376 [Pyropia yezoensis]|uniref:Uncharacterized protein n=1 Tax=Pyropia yezoensis TaxID=2788 RepID=A0ACC3BLD9_PYRYE|nr:hypothetical protein I4F81_001376 [Neopyropia yezoensis]
MAPANAIDASSYANLDEVVTKRLSLALRIDVAGRRLCDDSTATLTLFARVAGVAAATLDIRGLDILEVTDAADGAPLDYAVVPVAGKLGGTLRIAMPPKFAAGADATATVVVRYTTDGLGGEGGAGGACGWLTAAQTASGAHPFVFTQSEAIHARSIFPCQDTPSVKFPYTTSLTVRSPLVAVASALAVGDPVSVSGPGGGGWVRYLFEQVVPVPAYLVAFAAGELVSRDLSPRCRVWAQPSSIEAAAYEFAEVESLLSTAEKIAGPYVWSRYDLLTLPASFPYGGMENPCLTFVTPTLLAGDRSLVSVVAHEIAHSWSGNLVTSASWTHFWLNEGFTVFLERRIIESLHGSGVAGLSTYAGRQALGDYVSSVGESHAYTALEPVLVDDTDPDDAFSVVPYERGYNFLLHLRQLLTPGDDPAPFDAFLRYYFSRFARRSITSDDLRQALAQYFPDSAATLAAVDWQAWLKAPGGLPSTVSVDESLLHQAHALATAWVATTKSVDRVAAATAAAVAAAATEGLAGWPAAQLCAFLQHIGALTSTTRGGTPLDSSVVSALDTAGHFNDCRNSEVRALWLRVALAAHYDPAVANAKLFLTSQGRMKFVRPLYRLLASVYPGGGMARALFEEHRDRLHSIAAKMIEKDFADQSAVGAVA